MTYLKTGQIEHMRSDNREIFYFDVEKVLEQKIDERGQKPVNVAVRYLGGKTTRESLGKPPYKPEDQRKAIREDGLDLVMEVVAVSHYCSKDLEAYKAVCQSFEKLSPEEKLDLSNLLTIGLQYSAWCLTKKSIENPEDAPAHAATQAGIVSKVDKTQHILIGSL